MSNNPTNDSFFETNDAWFFLSLNGSFDENGVSFPHLIACGDMLNRDIFSAGQVRQALVRLHQRGLVEVNRGRVTVMPLTIELHHKIQLLRDRGMNIFEAALEVLNSAKLPTINTRPNVDFVTTNFMKQAYRLYSQAVREQGS